MDKKEKLYFSRINIEITRRCNLSCPHCLRGDAENKDITQEVIDKLLDRTCKIDWILFTGGEPTLCCSEMRYFLEGLKSRNIPLKGLAIITNGIAKSDDLVDLFFDYARYIHRFNKKAKRHIDFAISDDSYHNTDIKDNYKFWKSALGKVANVRLYAGGQYVQSLGRGQQYTDSIIFHPVANKICYLTNTDTDFPCVIKNRKIADGIMHLPCTLTLDCDGNFFPDGVMEWEHHTQENIIFSVDTADIKTAIDLFNVGKPYCEIVAEARLNQCLVLRNLGRMGDEKIIKNMKFTRQNDKEQGIVFNEDGNRYSDNYVYHKQYEKSTPEELVKAAYQINYGDANPEDTLNLLSNMVIHKTLSELKDKYDKT